jgi:hypothetical protein
MPRDAQTDTDTCYDCGREVSGALQIAARLWKSPADGSEHWGDVPLCPGCSGQRERRRRMLLSVAVVVVAALTAAAAYPLLP